MPEGRMIKKRVSDSKSLGFLKSDSARLLYTWLIPHLDVEGRYSADPDLIKGHIFPKVKSMTPKKIEKLLFELAEINLVLLYKANGEMYLELKKFSDYQKIDPKKEAKSSIPSPSSGITIDNSGLNHEKSSTSKVNESKVQVNESKSSCPKKEFSDIDVKLTALLIELILKNNPKSKVKNITQITKDNWINECRLLREKDGWMEDDIRKIINWCQCDSFWKTNILSMPKLREQIDQLALKCRSELEKTSHLRTGERK